MNSTPSRPHHVLYVENAPGFGGSTRCLLALARASVQRGDRTTLALAMPLPVGETAPAGAEVLHFDRMRSGAAPWVKLPIGARRDLCVDRKRSAPGRFRDDWPRVRELVRYVRSQRVDLIHANNELFSNRAAIAAGAVTGVPVISHQRGWGRKCLMSRILARGVHRFVAISRAVEGDLLRMGITGDRVVQIYDGIPIEAQLHSAADRDRIRRAQGWSERELVIAFPAVLTPWKGQRLFLRAFAEFSKQRARARALLVGGALSTEPDYPQELRDLAAALGVADRVAFIGHVAEVAPYYQAADVVVHGSVAPEPFGLVVLEAMVSGRPVIAADAGGPAEIITHGENGWLYRMGDESALVATLNLLSDDPELRGRLGRAGAIRAEDFRQDNCDTAIADLYASVLGEASSRLRGFHRWPSRPYYSCSVSSPPASAPSTYR